MLRLQMYYFLKFSMLVIILNDVNYNPEKLPYFSGQKAH